MHDPQTPPEELRRLASIALNALVDTEELPRHQPMPIPPPRSTAEVLSSASSSELYREALSWSRLRKDRALFTMWTGLRYPETVEWLVSLYGERPHDKVDAHTRVLHVIFELRDFFSLHQLSALFGGDHSNLRKLNNTTSERLVEALSKIKAVGFPPLPVLQKHCEMVAEKTPEELRGDLFFIADGSSMLVPASLTPSVKKLFYVHYKKHDAARFQLMCDAAGHICALSLLKPGKINDDEAFQKMRGDSLINEAYDFEKVEVKKRSNSGVRRRARLLLDMGYRAIKRAGKTILMVTQSGKKEIEKEGEEENPDVEFSPKIAKLRSVVERVFAALKQRHPLLAKLRSSCKTRDWKRLNDLLYIACAMLNREREIGDFCI